MARLNKILILAVLAITFVALTGVANATLIIQPTVKVDKLQRNGYYIGTPKILSGEFSRYGYEYVLVPDGTFTITGTITNDQSTPVTIRVGGGTKFMPEDIQFITVPAAGANPGKASFSLTFAAASRDDCAAGYGDPWQMIDLSKVDYSDKPDMTTHTIDQGPMSDATAIFLNGNITYNGSPAYSVS